MHCELAARCLFVIVPRLFLFLQNSAFQPRTLLQNVPFWRVQSRLVAQLYNRAKSSPAHDSDRPPFSQPSLKFNQDFDTSEAYVDEIAETGPSAVANVDDQNKCHFASSAIHQAHPRHLSSPKKKKKKRNQEQTYESRWENISTGGGRRKKKRRLSVRYNRVSSLTRRCGPATLNI